VLGRDGEARRRAAEETTPAADGRRATRRRPQLTRPEPACGSQEPERRLRRRKARRWARPPQTHSSLACRRTDGPLVQILLGREDRVVKQQRTPRDTGGSARARSSESERGPGRSVETRHAAHRAMAKHRSRSGPAAKIVTYIRWGSAPPYTIGRYEFRTLSEHAAFVQGVDEACGWMDYRYIEAGDCRNCAHPRGAHSDSGECEHAKDACGCTRFETYVSFERPRGRAASTNQFVAELEDALGRMGAASFVMEARDGSTTLLVGRGQDEQFRVSVMSCPGTRTHHPGS
jgi:hypothetical protein